MSDKGKRYTKEQKQEVIDFVNTYNSEHNGRGGVANATKKFGITAMTVKSWVTKDSGGTVSKKSGKKSSSNVFIQLGEMHDAINQKEAELSDLKKKFKALKKKAKI